jgi:predicted nucleic acid-binding protein
VTAHVAWLLDANVISEMMRPSPEPRVAAFLDRIARQGIGLASITVWEILNGISRLDAGRRRDDLAERFQDLVSDLFEERILDWTRDHAWTCARIMEQKRRQGEPLDDHLPDAFLAAMAAHSGLAVVTRNTSHFRNTGVEVFDPWAR